MKKLYKPLLFFMILILLSTFNPNGLKNSSFEKKVPFFAINEIKIIDNYLISKKEIDFRLAHLYGKNIFFLGVNDLVDPLLSIDYLKKVEIKKKYPNIIIVKIEEEKPIAVFNKKGKKFFISDSSKLISYIEDDNFSDLPNVFGDESELFLPSFLILLTKKEFPVKEIKNFYFYKIGRWDLDLLNGQLIKLPYENIENSIDQLIKLLQREDFKKYKVIDLRINGKIVTD